jgi:hypothetical protein
MKKMLTRRAALRGTAGGFGALAASWLLQREGAFAAGGAPRIYDLTPRAPHFPPKAKNVIFIYISGGASTIDMFDPKPALEKYDGKPAPFEIKGPGSTAPKR